MKKERPFLLVNINNTNTSFALANARRILRVVKVPTVSVRKIPFVDAGNEGIVLASVVTAMAEFFGVPTENALGASQSMI